MLKDQIVVRDSTGESGHQHTEIEVLYLIDGTVRFTCAGEKEVLRKGAIRVINSCEPHAIDCEKGGLYCLILLDNHMLCRLSGRTELLFRKSNPENAGAVDLRILINQLLRLYADGGEANRFYEQSVFYRFLDVLTQNYLLRETAGKPETAGRAGKISAYLHTHYREPLTLHDLAETFYLSDAYLSRYFKQQFGMNFLQYLNRIRMEHAADELKNTDQTATRIAMESGFSTPSAFNRKFRECFGMSPIEYRKKNKEEQKEASDNRTEILPRLRSYYDSHDIEIDRTILIREERIRADVTAWRRMEKSMFLLNAGACEDLLSSSIQQHLIVLNRKMNLEYVRIWAPFSKAMEVVSEEPGAGYHFEKLDRVLDFLLEEGIRPLIDLGNKPKRIQKSAYEPLIFLDNGEKIHSLQQWRELLSAWMLHLKERYGVREVSRWKFELWKHEEKNYWRDHYFELFDETRACIKKVFRNVPVGGNGQAISDETALRRELKAWNEHSLPDFLSFYLYPYEPQGVGADGGPTRSVNPNYIDTVVFTLRRTLKECGLGELPLIATEWNLTVSDRNDVNDSCARAAYYLHNRIRWAEETITFGYFHLSDCRSEHIDNRRLLFGAAGIITKNGIFKPAAYAMQFAESMQDYRIARGSHYLITTDLAGNYSILCENFKNFGYQYYMMEEDEISNDEDVYENMEELDFHFCLEHLANGSYQIRRQVVNAQHGSTYDEWKRYHFSGRIGFEDIEYFRHICVPQILVEEQNVENGILKFDIRLIPHEIDRIDIQKIG